MESTTLVTFMLQHPTASKVELLGSWDNFSKPYGMERDRRRGRDIWTGCHTFNDIICDGDDEGIHEKRDGQLRMGGTYWYFYRVDDDEEFYDPTQESTTACPLMPGQSLNVLEVPFDVERFGSHSRSASMISLLNIVKTLNPADRYVNPQPAPKPEVKASAEANAAARHLSAAHEERTASRKRRWSTIFEGRRAQQDYARGCAQRPVKSAPTGSVRPTVGHDEAAVALQHPWATEALFESQDDWSYGWAVRGDGVNDDRAASVVGVVEHDTYDLDTFLDYPSSADDEDYACKVSMANHWPLLSDSSAPLLFSGDERIREAEPSGATPFDKSPVTPTSHTVSDLHFSRPGRSSRRRSCSSPKVSESSSLSKMTTKEADTSSAPDVHTLAPLAFVDQLEIDRMLHNQNAQSIPSPNKTAAFNMERDRLFASMRLDHDQAQAALSFPPYFDSLAATPPLSLLPQPSYFESYPNDMHRALQTLDNQYARDRHYTFFTSPSTAEDGISNAASPIFSSIHGDASDTCTSHRASQLPEWPLKPSSSGFDHFDFQLDIAEQSFEHLSVHTTETGSTTSTAMPYQLPGSSPFAQSKASLPLQTVEQREETLLDEFEYLGAALL